MNEVLFKVLRKSKILNYLNFTTQIFIDGKKFKIPVLRGAGDANLNMSELWMVDVLKTLINLDQGIFVDVGVNTGQTLLKLRSVSPGMDYIGFEPNSFCVEYVEHLKRLNDYDDVKIIPVGISDKTELGILNFYENSNVDSSASMIEGFRSPESLKKTSYIPLFRVKDLEEKVDLSRIAILKIDVEGGELEVLTSFKDKIAKQKPIILLEILPAYGKENIERIERQMRVQEMLSNLDYIFYRIIKRNNKLIKFESLAEIEIHSDLNMCDYLVIPRLKNDAFRLNNTYIN